MKSQSPNMIMCSVYETENMKTVWQNVSERQHKYLRATEKLFMFFGLFIKEEYTGGVDEMEEGEIL